MYMMGKNLQGRNKFIFDVDLNDAKFSRTFSVEFKIYKWTLAQITVTV